MKFAEELENEIVQEWLAKYVDYRTGKQRIKGIVRAASRLHPGSQYRGNSISNNTSNYQPNTLSQTLDGLNRTATGGTLPEVDNLSPEAISPLTVPSYKWTQSISNVNKDQRQSSLSLVILKSQDKASLTGFPTLSPQPQPQNISSGPMSRDFSVVPERKGTFSNSKNQRLSHAYNLENPQSNHASSLTPGLIPESPKSFLSEIFSGAPLSPFVSFQEDGNISAIDLVRQRQIDFFKWIDQEMEKVETFYKLKEKESRELLVVLRDQLHEMRERRAKELDDLQNLQNLHQENKPSQLEVNSNSTGSSQDEKIQPMTSSNPLVAWYNYAEKSIVQFQQKFTKPNHGGGANSGAMQNTPITLRVNSHSIQQADSASNLYTSTVYYSDSVSYRTAKKKLKIALLGAYQDMELLKSYSLINRAAFRKITRKYCKTVDDCHFTRLFDKVNKAWFVQSDVLDVQMQNAIDLYARYFECGHQNIAIGKLRRPFKTRARRTGTAFRSGLMIGIGIALSIQAIINAVDLLHYSTPEVRMQTGYLLQLYAGFLLALYLFAFFCLDSYFWVRNKINYRLIFEFDSRHILDWKELTEIPSLMIALLGLFAWINFSKYGTTEFYIYWPIVFVSTIFILFFLPVSTFFRSRRWLLYTHWRLLLAGFYPVEFRDVFLGDIYCSLTYVMANIEVFFCLYAHHWNNPPQCGSSHSVILGFLTTLPGTWRSLQCLRRYYDSRDIFPHLPNCGKYLSTILFYATLSIYRRDRIYPKLIIFLAAASVNSVYTYIWDILMDWSLLQPKADTKLLRNVRGVKNPIWYYAAMILNAVLRLTWIFYALFPEGVGHSTLVTFFVAFVEVTRRGIWVFFRVENEHCSNIENFKASRKFSLPYTTKVGPQNVSEEPEAENPLPRITLQTTHGTIRSSDPRQSFSSYVANAHRRDFEKKRKPKRSLSVRTSQNHRQSVAEDSDAESSDDDYASHTH